MTAQQENSVLEISALGRPLHLGTLYNIRNHCLVPGKTLWNDSEIQQKTRIHNQPSTKSFVEATDSFSERTKLLDLCASLKMSILVGLVDIKGSAEYLKNEATSTRQCSVTMHFYMTTVSKKLKISDMTIQYPDVFRDPEPTHVVIEVLYGANALMEFQSMASDESEKQNIQGSMKIMVTDLSKANTSGDVKMHPEDKNKLHNISCMVYGDVQLKENPSTYEDAVKVYRELPTLLGQNGEKAVPVRVWLYPLNKLNDVATKITNKISDCVLFEVGKIIDDLHQARITTNDLIENCKSIEAVDIICKLERFQRSLRTFTAEFLQKLRDLLPAIRGGTAEESALTNHLASLDASGFSREEMDIWIKSKTVEVTLLTSYIRELCKLPHCELKCPGPELELLLSSTPKDVVMFCFTSLNDEEPYLKKIEKSSPNASPPEQNTKEMSPWYKTTSTTETALEVFKRQKDCVKAITFITDTDHPGVSVRVYHRRKLKYKNLKLDPQATINYVIAPLNTRENEDKKNNIETIPLRHRSAKHLRFLVIGPVAHGRSSFINSVNSAFQGRICVGALADAISHKSFTQIYKTHPVKNKWKRCMPFVFSDIMGLENEENKGIAVADVITCLGGHVRENYPFNALAPLREGDVNYNKNPSVDNKVHCLVTVVSAEEIIFLKENTIQKIKSIINIADDMGIPSAVVMTKIDRTCPAMKDLSKINSIKNITQKIKECHKKLGVPMQYILPVKNYNEEIKVDPKVDCLLLRAFEQLVLVANSYIECL